MSSAAFSRLRDQSAVDASNVRNDSDGALVTRPGHRRIPSDGETIVSIFAHFSHVLGVTGSGELKWETEQRILNAVDGDSLFRSFIPARTGFSVINPTNFISNENVVYVSNPNSQLKVVLENGSDPEAVPFYIPPLGPISVVGSGGTSVDDIFIRVQPITTIQEGATFNDYPIEAVGQSSGGTTRFANDSVLDIEVDANDLATDTDADYIDVFQTRTTAADENATFYWLARFPYAVGTHRTGIKADTALETERTLVEPFATPAWQISEKSNDRMYLNTGNSPRLYMTYYDSGGDKYVRTVSDFLDVQTGGFPITGLKIFQQNMIAVYTENRIFLLNVDPIATEHRVVEIISTRDDRDAPIGCIAPESIVDINGYHYFLAGNQQVYRYGGQRVSWLSAPTNPTLAKVPRVPAKKAVGFARGLT